MNDLSQIKSNISPFHTINQSNYTPKNTRDNFFMFFDKKLLTRIKTGDIT